jgi:hypothetical protein
MIIVRGESDRPKVVIEEVTNPDEIARFEEQYAQAQRNWNWLEAHWPDLLPHALGKYVAVAGQEAFIAEDGVEARAQAVAAHPEDKGVIVQFVRPEKGPRIYANRREMVPLF